MVADLYRGDGDVMMPHSADGLTVHRDPGTSVVVREYAVRGRTVRTGQDYDSHFVSVITVKDSEVAKWRTGGTAWIPSPSSGPSDGRRRITEKPLRNWHMVDGLRRTAPVEAQPAD